MREGNKKERGGGREGRGERGRAGGKGKPTVLL